MLTVRDFLMPDLGEGLTEGEINRWLVAEGDVVVVDQPDRGDHHRESRRRGADTVRRTRGRAARRGGAEHRRGHAADQHRGRGGASGGRVGERAGRVRDQRVGAAHAPQCCTPGAADRGCAVATVAHRHLRRRWCDGCAAELGIDLSTVAGSGPGGMVTRADLETRNCSRRRDRGREPAACSPMAPPASR